MEKDSFDILTDLIQSLKKEINLRNKYKGDRTNFEIKLRQDIKLLFQKLGLDVDYVSILL